MIAESKLERWTRTAQSAQMGWVQLNVTFAALMQREVFARLPRFVRYPWVQLTALGVLSALFYFHLTLSYPLAQMVAKHPLTDFGRANGYLPSAMYDYIFSLAAPFVAYLLAWKILQRCAFQRRLLFILFFFAILFAATLVVMYPIGATDMFDYVFYSRIWVRYHQNPLAVPPINFRDDPFFRTVIWYKTPSPYGPLWLLLTAPGSWIAGDDLTLNLLMMHALPAIFFVGGAALIAAILQRSDPQHLLAGALLYAWNPLVLFEGAGNGHNGIIMMFFVLLAVYFLIRRNWVWVLPALVASVLVKYISAILILPFLIYCWRAQPDARARWHYLWRTVAISAALAALVASPFFALPTGLLDEANWYSLLAVPTLGYQYLKTWLSEGEAKTWVIGLTAVLYLALYAWSLKRIRVEQQPRRLLLLCTWLTLAYLTIACVYFQPWFIKWIIALGIWANHRLVRRVLLTFTISGLASYAVSFYWVWYWNVWSKMQVNWVFVIVIFLPPLVVGLASLVQFKFLGWLAARQPQAEFAPVIAE